MFGGRKGHEKHSHPHDDDLGSFPCPIVVPFETIKKMLSSHEELKKYNKIWLSSGIGERPDIDIPEITEWLVKYRELDDDEDTLQGRDARERGIFRYLTIRIDRKTGNPIQTELWSQESPDVHVDEQSIFQENPVKVKLHGSFTGDFTVKEVEEDFNWRIDILNTW